MHMLLDALVGSVLLAWLAVTAVSQIPGRALRDPLGLVPRWTFFAPNPGEFDYHLLFRDFDDAELPVTPWREIRAPARRSLLSALWNPEKRYRKGVIDCCQSCVPSRGRNGTVRTSVPYLALLNVVMAEPRVHGAHARAFVVVATKSFAASPADVLIRSDVHAL